MRTESGERPAALATLFYVFGLIAAPWVSVQAYAALGLFVVGLLVVVLKWPMSPRIAVLVICLAGGVFIGGRTAQREASDAERLSRLSPDAFSTVRLEVEDDWAPRPDGASRLKARAFEVLDESGGRFPIRGRLYVLLYDTPPEIGGARWIVARGFLRRLDRGAFVLSVKSAGLVRLEGLSSGLDPRSWNRWFSRNLDTAASGSAQAVAGNAIVQALVLGRGALVPWEVIDVYQRGGTYHLLVFSGVQIAMMAALVRWALLRLRLRRTADAALILICAFMPRFVGADPSVSRSSLMIGLLLGCWLWKRPTDAANLVFVSALVWLIVMPEDLMQPGFALTYSATAGILVAGRALADGRGWVGRLLAYGLGAEVGTTPFTLLFFNRATLGGSIVTLLVSPVVTIMLGFGFLAVGLAPFSTDSCRRVLELVGWMNGLVMWANRFVAEGVHLSVVAASPAPWILVVSLVVATVSCSTGTRRGSLIAAACLLVPVGSAALRSAPNERAEASVYFLDVGQGDATLVISQARSMLVDGGGSTSDPAFGTRTLLPLLAERRARHLDAVALSHPHPDHCSGLVAVLRDLEVDRLIISRRHLTTECGTALVDVAMKRRVPVVDAESVTPFALGEFNVEVFGTEHRYRKAWENNSSVLLRLSAGRRRFLLTGDIEREAERVLLEQQPYHLAADVLKVPHHGSRSSTTSAFVRAVGPRIAAISCGVRNRFGHPHAEPQATLAAEGARIERTSTGGTLWIRLSEERLFLQREFDSSRRRP